MVMTFLRVSSSCNLGEISRHTLIQNPGAFYMVGDFESARAKGEKILAELEKS